MKLTRKDHDYYTQDGQYKIQKGCWGWNIYERDKRRRYVMWQYLNTTETLKEAKESLTGV